MLVSISAEADGQQVMVVDSYAFAKTTIPSAVSTEIRWLCTEKGCFTTVYSDQQGNVEMFGWPYHSHARQLMISKYM